MQNYSWGRLQTNLSYAMFATQVIALAAMSDREMFGGHVPSWLTDWTLLLAEFSGRVLVWILLAVVYRAQLRRLGRLVWTDKTRDLVREIRADRDFEVNCSKKGGNLALAATIWCLYQLRLAKAVSFDRMLSTAINLLHRLI